MQVLGVGFFWHIEQICCTFGFLVTVEALAGGLELSTEVLFLGDFRELTALAPGGSSELATGDGSVAEGQS